MSIPFAVIDVLAKFAGFFVITVALPFEKDGMLPKWAWMWDNYEDGIDGPDWWKERYPDNAFQRRWLWLAWRNMFHNGGSQVLGFHRADGHIVYDNESDPSVWNRRSGARIMLATVDRFPFSVMLVNIVWIYPFNQDRCLEWRWGWKLWEIDSKEAKDPWVNLAAELPHPWRATVHPRDQK